MPHSIEQKATEYLIGYLESKGSIVQRSDLKTFDIIVDGKYAEIKSKNKCLKDMDFISLSEKQYKAAQEQDFDIYLVCNVENIPEVYKISASDLITKKVREVKSYEFDRKAIIEIIN